MLGASTNNSDPLVQACHRSQMCHHFLCLLPRPTRSWETQCLSAPGWVWDTTSLLLSTPDTVMFVIYCPQALSFKLPQNTMSSFFSLPRCWPMMNTEHNDSSRPSAFASSNGPGRVPGSPGLTDPFITGPGCANHLRPLPRRRSLGPVLHRPSPMPLIRRHGFSGPKMGYTQPVGQSVGLAGPSRRTPRVPFTGAVAHKFRRKYLRLPASPFPLYQRTWVRISLRGTNQPFTSNPPPDQPRAC